MISELIDTYVADRRRRKGRAQTKIRTGLPRALATREHEVVILIFRLHYIEGHAGRKIPSDPQRRAWHSGKAGRGGGKCGRPKQVRSIYENEDYTGVAIANRFAGGFASTGKPKPTSQSGEY